MTSPFADTPLPPFLMTSFMNGPLQSQAENIKNYNQQVAFLVVVLVAGVALLVQCSGSKVGSITRSRGC